MAIAHRGSWWGLPDFGITEKIGSALSGGRSTEIIPKRQPAYSPPAPRRVPAPAPNAYTQPTYQPQGSGQPQNVQQQQNVQQGAESVLEGQQEQQTIDYDALIAPALQQFDQSMQGLQGAYTGQGGIIEGIGAGFGSERAQGVQSFGQQEQTIGRSKEQTQAGAETAIGEQQQMGESAVAQARRQAAEMQQGIQSRFGRGTPGQAFSEILGSQATRNIAGYNTQTAGNVLKLRQQLNQAMTGLNDKLQEVQEIGRIALQDVEARQTQEIAKAKAELERELASIRASKGELQANKVSFAQNALQFYQTQVAGVNARSAAFKQQLYSGQQAAQQQLQVALAKAQNVASSIKPSQFQTIGLQDGGQQGYIFNPNTEEVRQIPSSPGGITSGGLGQDDEYDDFING